MSVSRIIYLSKGTRQFTPNELMGMNAAFASNNARFGVTGVLLRVGHYFIQVIEGERSFLDQLLATISADTRHECVTVLAREDEVQRVFGQWSMGLLDLDSTYYLKLDEAADLRDQIEDIIAMSLNPKRTFESLLKQITRTIRAAAPRAESCR